MPILGVIMNESALLQAGKRVAGILRENGFVADAEALESALAVTGEVELQIQAAEHIKNMCHIKWLGDTNIKTHTWPAWLKELNRLHKAANKTIKKLRG